MALIINKENLKKSDGTDLPSQGVFVKFIFQSDFESMNFRYYLRYYVSKQLKDDGYSAIQIVDLPNQFDKEISPQIIAQYEQLVNGLIPNEPASVKILFAYHLWVKEELEQILGENTVEIRPDLT